MRKIKKLLCMVVVLLVLLTSVYAYAGTVTINGSKYNTGTDSWSKSTTLKGIRDDSWSKTVEFSYEFEEDVVHTCNVMCGLSDNFYGNKDYIKCNTIDVAQGVYVRIYVKNGSSSSSKSGWKTNSQKIDKLSVKHKNSEAVYYVDFAAN